MEHRIGDTIFIRRVALSRRRWHVFVFFFQNSVRENRIFFEMLYIICIQPTVQHQKNCATTHKLDGETSMFLSILLDPYVLEVTKGSFVRTMLDVTCKSAVVHHSYWPKTGNGFDDLSSLFIQWAQVRLSLAFLKYKLHWNQSKTLPAILKCLTKYQLSTREFALYLL